MAAGEDRRGGLRTISVVEDDKAGPAGAGHAGKSHSGRFFQLLQHSADFRNKLQGGRRQIVARGGEGKWKFHWRVAWFARLKTKAGINPCRRHRRSGIDQYDMK